MFIMKKRRLYIALFVMSLVLLSIGGTFAYLTTSATATNITQIKSGNLTMTIDGGGNTNTSFMPSKCTSKYAIKKTIKASAVNTSGGKVSFSIGMNITTLSDTLKRNTMRYVLSTNSSSCSIGIVAGGTFKDKTAGDEVWLIKNDYDNITKSDNTYTKTYYLYIWLDESETENLSGSISVNMKGTSSNNPNLPIDYGYKDGNGTNTLFYKIKSSADTTTIIDFSKTSEATSTNGIYTTTNTENGIPVYYYRGAIDNNHVIFANFCWRIIRTTETGGVKLIYDGVPSSGQCNNTGNATTIGSYSFNPYDNSPAFEGYMYGTVYTVENKDITTLTGSIVFGNDITYDKNTNKYTLTDTYTLTDPSNWADEYTTISNKYHYTCFNSSNTCEIVNYIYTIYSKDTKAYYFELSDGKNHLDILKEMLDNSTNTTDSIAKTNVDEWYKNNMTGYTSQLEDTIFCNDRSYNVSASGWNKDYSNYNKWLYFSSRQRVTSYKPSLICPSGNDKFTVSSSNGNGSLTYPVGLITADEAVYAGAVIWNSFTNYYLYNGSNVRFFSPYALDVRATSFYLSSTGNYTYAYITNSNGLRPSISLKQGTVLSSGSGTSTDPFIVG